ncbi:MAG TPA: serine/threonine-protein kinase [Candidatus Sulfomarinibacteraceae bacterium]|nr:serine/threonine-protein kinase [Candidatus Sulfomarinibacteraceae bacterium]
MQPERWRRARAIFDQVVDLDRAARDRVLDELVGDDDELRREVESLLASSSEAETDIPRLIGAAARSVVSSRDGARVTAGGSIGPYRLISLLGQGGMGSVYLAERSDGSFSHRVALKVLRSGLAATGLEARFKSERQILADLRHPNIARLIDGGATDDGSPYLVLEHVEGRPVDRWCDEQRLTVDQRLDLFRVICSAVQAAHRNLVVHRDLKPANILVTADGHPKLLDFGIAKLLGPPTHDHTMAVTGTLDRLLTPAYASPEQVLGRPVTTASDVYSLGVLLYELLVGSGPHALANPSATEIERIVCRDLPDRPSLAVRRSAGTPAGAESARLRRTTPDRLARRLGGDLDTIVMTALRKEPDRRYPSVEALAEDVRRHLAALPIAARPDTLGYRAGKFVRRHRGSVTAGALAVAAVLVFGVLSAVNARIATAERDRARAAEERARVEARTAETVSSFLVDLFRDADPSESRGAEVTARELLDRGAAQLDGGLADEPGTRARLLRTVGEVYTNLGEYPRAAELLAEATAVLRRDDPSSPELPAALNELAKARFDLGDLESAERLSEEALAAARRSFDGDHRQTAMALNNLGWLAFESTRLDDAERYHREALEMRTRLHGTEHDEVAESLFNLGTVMLELARLDEAAELHRRGYEMRRRVLGDDHPLTLGSVGTVAATYEAQKRVAEALELIDTAMPTAVRVFGPDHPDIAYLEVMRGRQYRFLGRTDEAVAAFEEAARIERLARGPDHPYVGYAEIQRGSVLAAAGRLDEAEAAYREALRIYRAAYPEGDRNVANVLGKLAKLEIDRGDGETALDYARESRELFGRQLPEGHTELLEGDIIIGFALAEAGRTAEARSVLESALPRIEAAGYGDSPEARRVRAALAALPEAS